MKHIPILFSTLMVQAILDGRKTQTRRIVTPQPIYDEKWCGVAYIPTDKKDARLGSSVNFCKDLCPYGQVGDVLWVREEHYSFGHWEPDNSKKRKSGRQAWKFVTDSSEIRYFDNQPFDFRKGRHHKDPYKPAWHKRLARFMPKKCARTFLEVLSIRVERLQDISGKDATAEGIKLRISGVAPYESFYAVPGSPNQYSTALHAFCSLWQSINGAESWDANPWVWVVEFKRVEKPLNF